METSINEKFDVVYSWGVLHHTGNMWKAIENASELVKDGGKLYISIYVTNRFCSIWKQIKKTYTYGGILTKFLISFVWYPLHFFGTLINGSLFKQKGRGMLWFYDSKDWLGGYPYESANKNEVINFIENKGFTTLKSHNTEPNNGIFGAGCAEYLFSKKTEANN